MTEYFIGEFEPKRQMLIHSFDRHLNDNNKSNLDSNQSVQSHAPEESLQPVVDQIIAGEQKSGPA